MKKLPTLILLASILLSCNQQKTKIIDDCSYNDYSKYELIKSRDLIIPIDNSNNFMSTQTHVRGDSLIRANFYNSYIDIFSISKSKKIKSFKLRSNDENRIRRFGGSAIVPIEPNEFLIGSSSSNLFHTKNDSIISKTNLSLPNSKNSYRIYGVNENLPIKIGNNIYFSRIPPYMQIEDDFYKTSNLIKYDIINKTINELNVYYPEEYKEGIWGFAHIIPSFTYNNNDKIIFSFPLLSQLYSYDIAKDTLTAIESCTKSKFVSSSVESLKSFEQPFYEVNQYTKSQHSYWSIQYDKYNKLYYRLITLPVENKKDIKTKDRHYMVAPLVLMVLNEDFEVICEKKLPPNKYNYNDYFVTEEGFWLSNNNPNSDSFNEDKLSFSLFKVIKK